MNRNGKKKMKRGLGVAYCTLIYLFLFLPIAVVAANCDDGPCTVTVPLPISSRRAKNLLTGEEINLSEDTITVEIDANSAVILKVWDSLMEAGAPLDEEDMEPEQLKELLGEHWEE